MDLVHRRFAELVGLDNEEPYNLSETKDLDWLSLPLDEPCIDQNLGRDLLHRTEPIQRFEIHNGVLHSERIVESILGQATDEGHLSSLESGSISYSRPGLQALVSSGC